MTGKRWFISVISILGGLLLCMIAITVVVDPYFHYHAPLEGTSYRLYEERYINDGIARNFDYDAIIIGSSMVENFKTSEMDNLFGTKSVKLPYSGALYQEIATALDRAISRNNNVAQVIWCLDYSGLVRNYDASSYSSLPEYLYNDCVLDDVSYCFNKDILYRGTAQNLLKTIKSEPADSFDEYANWEHETGLEHILLSYTPNEDVAEQQEELTPATKELVTENITRNVVELTRKYPEVTFNIYLPAYSIVYWDEEYRNGEILPQIEAEEITLTLLTAEKNVRVFSFVGNTDVATNLELFNDKYHSNASINSKILCWIKNGDYEITKDNLSEHISYVRDFYTSYDYEGIYN